MKHTFLLLAVVLLVATSAHAFPGGGIDVTDSGVAIACSPTAGLAAYDVVGPIVEQRLVTAPDVIGSDCALVGTTAYVYAVTTSGNPTTWGIIAVDRIYGLGNVPLAVETLDF